MFFNWDEYKFCIKPGLTDMRGGATKLVKLIIDNMHLDPHEKIVFMFFGSNGKAIKAIIWDGNGFWLLSKKLYLGTYSFPRDEKEAVMVERKELEMILNGANLYKEFKQFPNGLAM